MDSSPRKGEMKYKCVLLPRRGNPEVLRIVERDLRDPKHGEARVRILATGVGLTDVTMRRKLYFFAPRFPFVPGYEFAGVVDAVGPGVTHVRVGDHVTALTIYGAYSEYIYIGEEHLVRYSPELDPAEVAALPLNYVTAYQMLHRVAKVQPGNKILVTGASGGVGTAVLQLGKLAGQVMYGTASAAKHDLLNELGAVPIDYRTQDIVEFLREREPEGIDYVFNAMAGDYITRGFRVLRRGGKLVEYGSQGVTSVALGWARLLFFHLWPNGKSAYFYGITPRYWMDKRPFMEDMNTLLDLLGQQKIAPVIASKLPILEARKANELLESGSIRGKIILVAPELLPTPASSDPASCEQQTSQDLSPGLGTHES